MEKGDNQKCYAYAAAGLAQGPARKEALFLNTNVSNSTAYRRCCFLKNQHSAAVSV
jgi:hypothetical protein